MKHYLNRFKPAELVFVIIILSAIIISSLICKSNFIDIIIAVFGIIYVFLIGKKQKRAYFYGMINVFLYAIVMFNKGLYLNFVYNMFYSFPMLIYGYFYWKLFKNETKINLMTKKNHNYILYFTALMIVITVGVLILVNDKATYLDYITSISGCLAMFLMARKYKEQWIIWNLNNLTNVILWGILTIGNINNIGVLIMWIGYLANSIYGTISWELKNDENKKK